MSGPPKSGGGEFHEARPATEAVAALWNDLVLLLGSAAAATLLRRAVRQAGESTLPGFAVVREGLDYCLRCPREWDERGSAAHPDLRRMVVSHLVPLLREFTGELVVRRLGANPALADLGIHTEVK